MIKLGAEYKLRFKKSTEAKIDFLKRSIEIDKLEDQYQDYQYEKKQRRKVTT